MILKKGALATMALILACAVWAGDGIPMGSAIFYPSIEANYTGTDNIYLQNNTMPYGNVSNYWWQIRPSVGFLFPFKESYVRVDAGYQYVDYGKGYTPGTHDTYTGDIVGVFKFGHGNSFTFSDNYIHGLQEVNKFDPGYEQYYNNTPFNSNAFKMAVDFAINKSNTLGVYAIYNDVSFTDVSPNTSVPFFSYQQVGGGLLWKYNYRPNADWLMDVSYLYNKPTSKVWDEGLLYNVNSKKYNAWMALTGIEGDMGTMLSGYAKVGWATLNYDNSFSNFNGFVAKVGLGIKPSEFFRINLDLNRIPYQSAYNVNNYYTATGGQVALTQQVTRHFFWTAGYFYQENAYPDFTSAYPLGIGGATSNEFIYSAGEKRNDKISRAFAELGYHFTKQWSVKFNYQYEDRNSNIQYTDPTPGLYWGYHQPYSYTENRYTLSAKFGW